MDIFIPQGAESMLWKLWTDRFDLIFNIELPQIIIKEQTNILNSSGGSQLRSKQGRCCLLEHG
jgi:hypothetical protein